MNKARAVSSIMLASALLVGLLLLRRYLGLIAIAGLTVILFYPLQERLKRGRLRRFSTAIITTIALLCLAVPIVLVAIATFYQSQAILSDVEKSNLFTNVTNDGITATIHRLVDQAISAVQKIPVVSNLHISSDQITTNLNNFIHIVGSGLLSFVTNASSGVFGFAIDAILYFIVLVSLFAHSEWILAWLHRISPLRNDINHEYAKRIRAMAVSMVKGTFIISLMIGFVGALTLWFIGFPYFFFWFILLTILAFIPLGAGVALFPIGAILLVAGQVWQGLLVLAVWLIFVNNIDNVMRPLLVSGDSKMNAALVLLSAFAGIGMFGILGVVYGPIIMIVVTTTIEMYDEYAADGIPLKRD